MSHFTPKQLTLAIVATSMLSTPAIAQEAPTAGIEEVVVTGFRASLKQAQDIKKVSSSIVEAMTAEDIGKLPDSSIAESLARLPGLAGERRDGRTSGLSVRGFNENYVATTLNGRELLGIGDNRGVEYDLYPSEMISSVVVYKTPEASLSSQGIGGTVDLRTTRPLDVEERVLAFNGLIESNQQSSANPDFDDQGHRVAVNYADNFMEGKLGLAVTLASTESPSQEEQFRAWGYASVNGDNIISDTNPDGSITLGEGVSAADVDGAVLVGGHDSFARSSVLERDTVSAVLQFAPSDSLTLTLDVLSIDFKESKVFRGIEEAGPEWGASSYSIDRVENGLVTAGSFEGFRSVIRNDAETKEGELSTVGLNVDWALNDSWTLGLDAAQSESTKKIVNIESYSGVGRALSASQGAGASYDFVLENSGLVLSPTAEHPDYTDQSLIRLAGPQAWGGALAPFEQFSSTAANNPEGLGQNTAQDGFVNTPEFEEELTTFSANLKGELEGSVFSTLHLGFTYSDRSKEKLNTGAFLTSPLWPSDGLIPSEYVVGNTDLAFVGAGQIIAYDTIGLYNSGYYISTDASQIETARGGDTYTIKEELLNAYVQADIETNIGGIPVTGNIGVQLAQADQSSQSFDSVIGADLFAQLTPVNGSADYTKVLPSFNLSFEVADNQFVRTSASKVLSRPRMDDMRAGSSINFQFNDANIQETSDPNNSAWTASSGNPELRPNEANQFDLAYEMYFGGVGVFSIGAFYKDITNWHINATDAQDFTAYLIDGYHVDSAGNAPTFNQGVVSTRADGLKGDMTGYEAQLSLPFGVLSEVLEGFGLVTSIALNDGEFEDGSRIPGLSEQTMQATLYYEAGGFSARVSMTDRDEYLTERPGLSLALTPEINNGGQLVDAQIGFDFGEAGFESLDGLTVTLQGQNITDEADRLFDEASGDGRRVTRYSSYGANYLLGINYKF